MVTFNCLSQCNENRVRHFAPIHSVQLPAPPREQAQALGRITDLITKVIGPAAKRIDVVEILVKRLRQQVADDLKVLVVVRSEPTRIGLRLFARVDALASGCVVDELLRLQLYDRQIFRVPLRDDSSLDVAVSMMSQATKHLGEGA